MMRDEAGWDSHDLCILEGNIQRCSPEHPPGELPHRTGKSIVLLSAKSPIAKVEKRRDREGFNGYYEFLLLQKRTSGPQGHKQNPK